MFLGLVAGSTAIDTLAAGLVLFRAGRSVDLRQWGWAALAATAAFGIKLILLEVVGLGLFGIVHLIYADLVVLVPGLALALLVAERLGWVKATRWARAAAWVGLTMAFVGGYATWIEPFRLQLETATLAIPPERTGAGPVRIAVLADLQTDHVTDYERGAVARLMATQPDIILIPGDLFQGREDEFEHELPALRRLLGRLSAPGGVYIVPGDVDQPPDRIVRLAEGTRLTPLINDLVQTTVGDRRLTIAGIELTYQSAGSRATIRRLETEPEAGDLRILVAHRPDVAFELAPGSRIDLVVAGHTHGGQVVLPLLGPPMTLSDLPRRVAAGGLHEFQGHTLYISRGVGFERGQAPQLRFLCPPEISLLTLTDPPS